jgi:hypothetical protein
MVRLYGLGYAVATIQEICECGRTPAGGNRATLQPLALETLHGWLHGYKPNQLLAPTEYGDQGEFWSLGALAGLGAKRFGVRYWSLTSYRNLMVKCEFSYQRTTQQYPSC